MSSPSASWNEKPLGWKVERAMGPAYPVFAEINNPVYEKLLENLPIMLHSMDGSGRMTMANPAWLNSLGYSAVDVVGRSFSELLPSESRTKLITTIYPKYLLSGECEAEELFVHRKDGSLATVQLTMIAYRGEKGRLQKSVCLLKDITAEKLAEMASGGGDRRYRNAFMSAGNGIAIVSPSGNVEKVNAALCRILKQDDDEISANSFDELIHKDDRGHFLNGIQRLLRGDSAVVQESLRFMAGNGKVVHAVTSVTKIKNDRDEAEQLVIQLSEVTDKRNANLSTKSPQDSAAVRDLADGTATEFGNLLTAIVGNMQLLEGRFTGDERAQKRFNEVAEAARKGFELTRQLLAFAQKQKIEPSVIEITNFIREVEPKISGTVGAGIELKTRMTPEVKRCYIDTSQLEATLVTLAANARDAMGGRGTLTIEARSVSLESEFTALNPDVGPGDYVLITMADTGSTLSAEEVEKAFQPNFSSKNSRGATGLGLSAVQGFIKQSGGHITINSDAGQGTTVKVYFPVTTKAAENGNARPIDQSRLVEIKPQPEPTATRAKILVVEDQEAVRAVACGFLEDFGYDIIEAGDGFEALAKLQENPDVDLMFSDVVMPGGMNGFDLAQAAQSMRPDLKVVHTSGYPKGAMVHQDEPRFKEGFIIMKPYRREDLQKIIKDALEKQ